MKIKLILFLCFLILFQITNAQSQFNVTMFMNGDTVNDFETVIGCKDSCYDFTLSVSGGVAPYSYLWNNAATTQATVFCSNDMQNYNDTVRVLVTDANSAQGWAWISLTHYSISQEICIVTVDSATNKNMIVWQQNADSTISSYNIYKETTVTNQFQLIGNVPSNSLSVFIDTSSNPAQVSAKYYITALNYCAESYASYYHKTMHLTINQGSNNAWNLIWENYIGGNNMAIKNRIWRGSSADNIQLLDSVSTSVTTYTDLNPPSGLLFYCLEMIPQHNCIPSLKNKISYSSSFSNIVDNSDFIGIDEIPYLKNISIYPNPSTDKFIIKNSYSFASLVEVSNICGEKISFISNAIDNNLCIDLSSQPKGIYIITLKIGNNICRQKLIKY
jgi:hypothetical protein